MKSRTWKIVYWVFIILFSGFMLFSAISELMHTPSADKVLVDLGYPTYLNTILGIAKILGVIALLQTRFVVIKEWAFAGFAIDIVGAWFSIAFASGSIVAATLPMLPFVIVFVVTYYAWKKTLQLSKY